VSKPSNVVEWVPIDEYIANRGHVFRSIESWRWWERANLDALVKAGAIARPTGRKLINPEACDRVVLQTGLKRVSRRKP
jgi:hypothetical protein